MEEVRRGGEHKGTLASSCIFFPMYASLDLNTVPLGGREPKGWRGRMAAGGHLI